MADIEVKVFHGGQEVKRIVRPLRRKDGRPAVTYQGALHLLVRGNEIHLAAVEEKTGKKTADGKTIEFLATFNDLLKAANNPQSKKTSKKEDPVSALLRLLGGGKKAPAVPAKQQAGKSETAAFAHGEREKKSIKTPAQPAAADMSFELPVWDPGQKRVIEYRAAGRILVNAGPGTGKTAVACARIAWLIDNDDVNPGRIWLISFTRTAVREVKDRIRSYLRDGGDVHQVKIATIDSHAWSIHSGFDPKAKILGTYDDNIAQLTELVKNHEGVRDYLDSVEHVIIDEAQDIVGPRAELIVEIIKNLPAECGVTVFSDDAQAIYGFARDEESRMSDTKQPTITERLRKLKDLKFEELGIDTVHRTKSATLKKIFTELRKEVMTPAADSSRKLDEIKSKISILADERIKIIKESELAKYENCFILYRRRADVLQRSSFFGTEPHRLRMSGLPTCLHPWIGACLSEYTASTLAVGEFAKLWQTKVKGPALAAIDEKSAWKKLVRVAGETDTVISMNRLRMRLGCGAPPADFCSVEIGTQGPIIGTIHACKGREADRVYLMMPATVGQNSDLEEEARVVFVGATRARKLLIIGHGFRQYAPRVDGSGRVFSPKTREGQPRAQVEIGRDGDIRASGIAGWKYFASAAAVRSAQKKLIGLAGTISEAHAESNHAGDHEYLLRVPEDDQVLAALSERIGKDCFAIGSAIQGEIGGSRRRPPDRFNNLRIFGIRTIVLPPESAECTLLHDPWAKSGIMLAPVVSAFTTAYFPYYY